jgi:U3 small nucleolar RNA-associated protein 10
VNSTSDDSCHVHLIETMEALPIKKFVGRMVCKVLGNCIKASQVAQNPHINRTGSCQFCQLCQFYFERIT